MKLLPLEWTKLKIFAGASKADLRKRINELLVDKTQAGNSTYVIRIASAFIVEYEKQLRSPVIYIGEGHLRGRLTRHLGWLEKFQEMFPEAPIEVKFCFPKTEQGDAANEQLEAYLLRKFKIRYGRFPLRNKIDGVKAETVDLSEEKTGQILGPGTGKGYSWCIRPLPTVKANRSSNVNA